MNANQLMNFHILGGQYAEVEGNRFNSIFIGVPTGDPESENSKGIQVLKMKCTDEAYKQLPFDTAAYPVDAEVTVRMGRGAQNKATQEAISIKVTKPASKAA